MDIKIFQWFPNTRKLGNTQKKTPTKKKTQKPNWTVLRWIRRRFRDPLRLIRHVWGPKGLVPQPLVVESHSSLPNGKLMPKFLSHQNAGGGHLLGWTRCECHVQGDRVSEKKWCVMQVTVRNIYYYLSDITGHHQGKLDIHFLLPKRRSVRTGTPPGQNSRLKTPVAHRISSWFHQQRIGPSEIKKKNTTRKKKRPNLCWNLAAGVFLSQTHCISLWGSRL